jgi:hypothetical protein
MHCVMSHKTSPTLHHHDTPSRRRVRPQVQMFQTCHAPSPHSRLAENARCARRISNGHDWQVSRLLMCVLRVLLVCDVAARTPDRSTMYTRGRIQNLSSHAPSSHSRLAENARCARRVSTVGRDCEVSRLLMRVPRVLMSATKRRARPGVRQRRRFKVDAPLRRQRVFVGTNERVRALSGTRNCHWNRQGVSRQLVYVPRVPLPAF